MPVHVFVLSRETQRKNNHWILTLKDPVGFQSVTLNNCKFTVKNGVLVREDVSDAAKCDPAACTGELKLAGKSITSLDASVFESMTKLESM